MPLKREPSPRYKLKTLSKQLRRLSFPTSPVDVQLARFAADAFDKYLTGACSLESAFGLGRKPGARGEPKARLKLAKAIYALRKAGRSWYSVLDELEAQGFPSPNLRTIKRTYKEFLVHLVAREPLFQDGDLFSLIKSTRRRHRRRFADESGEEALLFQLFSTPQN